MPSPRVFVMPVQLEAGVVADRVMYCRPVDDVGEYRAAGVVHARVLQHAVHHQHPLRTVQDPGGDRSLRNSSPSVTVIAPTGFAPKPESVDG